MRVHMVLVSLALVYREGSEKVEVKFFLEVNFVCVCVAVLGLLVLHTGFPSTANGLLVVACKLLIVVASPKAQPLERVGFSS